MRYLQLIVIMVLFLLFPNLVFGQRSGLPAPSRTDFFEINLCYSDENNKTICDPVMLPELVRNFDKVDYIDVSPVDPARNVLNLPNYPIARYHWWFLGFDVLPRVQRQYSDCVERQKVYQEILGLPLLDAPGSLSRFIIDIVREYLVPMDAIQRPDYEGLDKPPQLKDAIRHVMAAIASINLTVYHRGICEGQAEELKKQVNDKIALIQAEADTYRAAYENCLRRGCRRQRR